MSNEIPVVFHNGSNYNYYFIIKKPANEFGVQFECIGENTEKYKAFFIPIEKEIIKVDKEGNENIITTSYKIKFIDSAKFITSSLWNLFDNLAEGMHKIKCKYYDCFLEYESVKDNLIKYQCLSCNKSFASKLHEKLKNWFKNTFKFSDNNTDNFVLLLRKGVYPYQYMDDWEKFNERILSEKEEFYSNLNMEDITDADYIHAKKNCKDFEINNLGTIMICSLKWYVNFG